MPDRYKSEESRARALANLRGQPPAPEHGNDRAARHNGYGAVSAEQRTEREVVVYEAMGRSVPLRGPDGGVPLPDEMAIGMLAVVLVRLERVASWLEAHGWLDEKTGEPKPATELERRLRGEALDLAKELGLTPRSRLALGLQLQQGRDLAMEMAAVERAEREGGGNA